MREEYDFARGVRGKYARRFAQGTNVVVLDYWGVVKADVGVKDGRCSLFGSIKFRAGDYPFFTSYPQLSPRFLLQPFKHCITRRILPIPPAKSLPNQLSIEQASIRKRHIAQ